MTGTARRSRLSRQGIWGLAVLAAVVVAMAGIAALPYFWLDAGGAKLAERKTELHFLEARLKSTKGAQHMALTAADNIEPLFVPGSTAGLATASLQSLVAKIAQQNGMVVERTQALQTEQRDGLGVLRMEVEASGSIANLRGYLLAIEAGEPLVFINQAKMSADPSAGAGDGALPSDKLTVALQLEAYGWWRAEP
jgi:hypothetical protein